jgi:hypothetical protein
VREDGRSSAANEKGESDRTRKRTGKVASDWRHHGYEDRVAKRSENKKRYAAKESQAIEGLEIASGDSLLENLDQRRERLGSLCIREL